MNALLALGGILLRAADRQRRAVAMALYSAATAAAFALAFLLRFDFDLRVLASAGYVVGLSVLIPARLTANYLGRLGLGRWRYAGVRDLPRLAAAVTLGSVLFALAEWLLPWAPIVPGSVLVLEWILSGYLIAAMWLGYRLAYEAIRAHRADSWSRVLVVGAGEAGQYLINQMFRSETGLVPVAVVDDNPFRWGTLVHGVEVVGAVGDVAAVARDARAEQIIIATPSASPEQLRRIVESCEDADLPMKILPGIEEVLLGEADLGHLRNLEVEDLLGRDPVHLELPELARDLAGRRVLITGAAGSIGSELTRQVGANTPASLVLLDQAETPLYFLELEARRRFPELPIHVVVGSVTNQDTLDAVFEEFRPQRVFHAAAYKHVPMMQDNPWEAVRTNVLGTYRLARTAAAHGSESFLLISTDKAVRPSNVMGASKHVAERVIMHLRARCPEMAIRAVRFGNVLGSNGSVIPVFRQQLERGEPLTVTHEDVTRYFMTIPEAVQLVLQASVLEESRGRVSMLDMGEPMRILDLARRLLRFAGRPFRLGESVIVTGLRPGEKLHEELSVPEETSRQTSVPRVSVLDTAPDFGELPFKVERALDEGSIEDLVAFMFSVAPSVERPAVRAAAVGA